MIIYLSELVEDDSPAALQAKQMGLTSKGFGRWADQSGTVTHSTKNGQLVPVQTTQGPTAGGGSKTTTTTPGVGTLGKTTVPAAGRAAYDKDTMAKGAQAAGNLGIGPKVAPTPPKQGGGTLNKTTVPAAGRAQYDKDTFAKGAQAGRNLGIDKSPAPSQTTMGPAAGGGTTTTTKTPGQGTLRKTTVPASGRAAYDKNLIAKQKAAVAALGLGPKAAPTPATGGGTLNKTTVPAAGRANYDADTFAKGGQAARNLGIAPSTVQSPLEPGKKFTDPSTFRTVTGAHAKGTDSVQTPAQMKAEREFNRPENWREQPPEHLMSRVYKSRGQTPPSDPQQRAAAWETIKSHMEAKYPEQDTVPGGERTTSKMPGGTLRKTKVTDRGAYDKGVVDRGNKAAKSLGIGR